MAPALAVRDGVTETHRCDGHYPCRSGCDACRRAALRTKQHNRQLPKPGVLAVDIAPLSRSGTYMPAGAPQSPGRTYAQKQRSKAVEGARDAMLLMLTDARMRGEVLAVRADRGAGIVEVEDVLLGIGARLTLTQGAGQ